MKRLLLAVLAIGTVAAATCGIVFRSVPELERVFQKRGVSGTFVMFDTAANTMLVWNEERAKQRFAPVETFRIANAVIGLDVGAVKSIDDFVPYEVTQYTTYDAVRPFIYGGGRERAREWNRQMELRKAIRMSSTSIFRKLASLVGEERMRASITKLAYGNMEIGQEVNRFWRDGSLQISAVEQAEFLARLAQGRLPVTLNALEQTKELTLREKTAVHELHFKSGLLSSTGPRVGWWVGWIERENEVFSFALNIDMTNSADAQTLAAIGRDCLRAVGKL